MPDFQFQPYDNSRETASIAALMMRGADARAEALRAGADAQARAAEIGGQARARMGEAIGSGISGSIGQMLQQRQQAPILAQEAKARDLEIQQRQGEINAQQRTAADQNALDSAMGSGQDLPTITSGLQQSGHGHLVPSITDAWNKAQTSTLALSEAKKKAADAEVADTERQFDNIGSLAASAHNLDEFQQGVAALVKAGTVDPAHVQSIVQGVQVDPNDWATAQHKLQMLSPSFRKSQEAIAAKAQEPYTLSEGQQRVTPNADGTAPSVVKGPPKAAPNPTEASLAVAAGNPDPAISGPAKTALAVMKAQHPPAAGAATSAALTDDGIEYASTLFRVTGKMPALGNGAGDVKAKIISGAAAQAKALGQTPVASIQKQAAYAGDAKALAKMQGMSASAEAFESKATAQTGIIRELSEKVNRTQYPKLNGWILAGKADLLGDKDTQLLFNAVSTFSAEYAKIMEGSTGSASGSSDGARAAAQRLISAKLNKGTMQGTLDLMQREMDLTLQGYDATIAHITEKMGGSAPVSGGTIHAKDPQGNIHEAAPGTALPPGWVLQ